jgi:hypothetical protein
VPPACELIKESGVNNKEWEPVDIKEIESYSKRQVVGVPVGPFSTNNTPKNANGKEGGSRMTVESESDFPFPENNPSLSIQNRIQILKYTKRFPAHLNNDTGERDGKVIHRIGFSSASQKPNESPFRGESVS